MAIWSGSSQAEDYPYIPYSTGKMDPQVSGWPLTAEERAYVVGKPEHERRPGREANQHLPKLWPVVPAAGHWGGTSWLDTHTRLVDYVQANSGPIDILLVGDSITQQWGSPLDSGSLNAAWKEHFNAYKTLNMGIGGDKTQNVLWRLDHGGVEGIEPRLVILMIGNNNMFFTPETGVEAAAQGIRMCVFNVRQRFPQAKVVLVKILPCHAPENKFYQDILQTNAALEGLEIDRDPSVHVLDLTSDFTAADGQLRPSLYKSDRIHLSLEGYQVYAARLRPLVDRLLGGTGLGGKGLGGAVIIPAAKTSEAANAKPSASMSRQAAVEKPASIPDALLQPTPKKLTGSQLVYPYAPYNEGKLDPQLTGWPLTAAELGWVSKGEYFRKPGHEVQKHLPDMWFVTPTASHWQPKDGRSGNEWIEHHATLVDHVRSAQPSGIDIALIGDSITQAWGGGWDGAPWNAAWQKYFTGLKTVNLGIGGDRIENVLWRLDHGALDGADPKVIVLMIGVNNAPLVQANGVPAVSAVHGIKLCVDSLRLRCPESKIVLIKILPAFEPTKDVGQQIVLINKLIDHARLNADPAVQVVDMSQDFLNSEGQLDTTRYSDGHLHLSAAGYEVMAKRLKPIIEQMLIQ